MAKDKFITCGAHGCESMALVRSSDDAAAQGWFHDSVDGYGWICPKHSGVRAGEPRAPQDRETT